MERVTLDQTCTSVSLPLDTKRAIVQRQYRFAKLNVGLIAAYALLTALLRTPNLKRLDSWITRRLQRLTIGPVVLLLRAVSAPGERPAPVLVTAGAAAGLWFVNLRIEACCTAFTITGSVLNAVLKRLARRPRPKAPLVRLLFPRVLGSSFPSGHVMFYTVFYGFLTSLAFSLLHPSRTRTVLVTSCAGLITAVGPARIMLGAHWASDVTGAYLAGGVWLACIHEVYRRWTRATVQ